MCVFQRKAGHNLETLRDRPTAMVRPTIDH